MLMAKTLKLLINVVSGFHGLLESFHYMLTTFLCALCSFYCVLNAAVFPNILDKLNFLSIVDQWEKNVISTTRNQPPFSSELTTFLEYKEINVTFKKITQL